jgi:hypothetical protein
MSERLYVQGLTLTNFRGLSNQSPSIIVEESNTFRFGTIKVEFGIVPRALVKADVSR